MNIAREQAREAGRRSTYVADQTSAELAADAASDVWEPYLQDLVDNIMLEVASGQLSKPRFETWAALTRAKEALDD